MLTQMKKKNILKLFTKFYIKITKEEYTILEFNLNVNTLKTHAKLGD